MTPTPPYEAPVDDDAPLDAIEQALVRALVPILVRKIREAAAAAQSSTSEPQPAERQQA